jgi:predicted RNA-binding Zn ribbon-like protein
VKDGRQSRSENRGLVLGRAHDIAHDLDGMIFIEVGARVQNGREESRLDPHRDVNAGVNQRHEAVKPLIVGFSLSAGGMDDRLAIRAEVEAAGERYELVDYGDFLRWAAGAGVITRKQGAALARATAAAPAKRDFALASARHTRWVMRALFSSLAAGRLDPPALTAFNDMVSESTQRLILTGSSRRHPSRLQWHWRDSEVNCESPLWPVVWAAANLLSSQESSLIKECGGRDCGWLFVDRSRNGLRRWCEMRTCGTREKSRRRGSHHSGPSRRTA